MSKSHIEVGEQAAKEGILHLVALGALKLTTGFVTGMTVIIADGISTLADTLGIFASYLGLKISRKSADKHFEYGYYKIETLAALLISIGIVVLGFFVLKSSVSTFATPDEAQYRPFAITTTLIAIIHSYRLSKKLYAAGKESNSLSLITSAKDKRMDMIAGMAVFISIIANYQQIPYVEGVVSVTIALFILKVGISSTKESLFFLLDYWNDPKLTKKIKNIFKKEKDLIVGLKKIRLRRAGTFIFGEAYIDINPFAGLNDLREELDILQEKVKEASPYIKDFAIYSDIPKSNTVKIAFPVKEGSGMSAKLANTLNSTKSYFFVQLKDGKVKERYTKRLKESQKKSVQLSEFLKKEKVNILVDNGLNSLVYYHLRRTHHILIYPNFSNIKTVKEAIDLILIDA